MFKAILFDCDGLMFDTERYAQAIWRHEAEKYNIVLPDDFMKRITGGGGKDLQEYLAAIEGLSEVRKIISAKRFDLDYWRSFDTDVLSKPGLTQLFVWLDENGYKKAVCSSSSRMYVETLIDNVSVPLKYDAIICGDMVKHTKPEPEIFLRGAEELGCRPEECLVLEDSKSGVIAARRAGMHSVFIQDTIIPDEEMKTYIDMQCDDLAQVIGILEKDRENELENR